MFRRLESGLPKDPEFRADLDALGYFINNEDEIRMKENPRAYFHYFRTKNERHNDMQREAMNNAVEKIVSDRLQGLGLDKLRLPLGVSASNPNLPIFISSDIKTKKRVIILFYEPNQDLGIFAHRIIEGKGGINQGSAINFVKYVQSQNGLTGKEDGPGVILANMGQLRWCRRLKKAITQSSWYALPQKSAVDPAYTFNPDKNSVPGNASAYEHVEYIFNHIVQEMVDPSAKLDIIGVADSAVQVTTFLEKEENFNKWAVRVSAFATLATCFLANEIQNPAFAQWLIHRGRTYAISQEPASTFIADHQGTKSIPAYGCPVFSIGEPYYSETMMPKGYKILVDWFQEVANDPDYRNPSFKRFTFSGDDEDDVIPAWGTKEFPSIMPPIKGSPGFEEYVASKIAEKPVEQQSIAERVHIALVDQKEQAMENQNIPSIAASGTMKPREGTPAEPAEDVKFIVEAAEGDSFSPLNEMSHLKEKSFDEKVFEEVAEAQGEKNRSGNASEDDGKLKEHHPELGNETFDDEEEDEEVAAKPVTNLLSSIFSKLGVSIDNDTEK